MTDPEYIEALEAMVQHLKDYEFFYWDILPQMPLKTREAYARATGDQEVLE